MIAQAKDACGQRQEETADWLTEHLLEMGPEQALNFHSIMQGYMELSDKFGLWNAAVLILEAGCYSHGYEDFRGWLIAQGKETYLAALKAPDSLADIAAAMKDGCRFGAIVYVGENAYEELTGRDAFSDDDRRFSEELRRDIVYGEGIDYPHEWSEVAAYLPRLTAQHLTPEGLRACIRRGHLWNHDDPTIQKARMAAPKKKTARIEKKKGGKSR